MPAMRWTVLLVVALVACAPTGARTTASFLPTPSAPPTATATPTASATATPSPSAAGAFDPSASQTFVNAGLGYAVRYWSPWRRSACQSASVTATLSAGDTFLTLTEQQEQDLTFTDTGFFQAHWQIGVEVRANPRGLAPDAFFTTLQTGSIDQRLETVTVGGRTALKVTNGTFGALAYLFTSADRAILMSLRERTAAAPAPSEELAALDAMAASIEFRVPATQTAVPVAGTPEATARALADAYARRDADALATLITPRCWFTSGLMQAGSTAKSPSKVITDLRNAFGQGLTVTVDPTVLPPTDVTGQRPVRATWTDATGAKGGVLLLGVVDGRWYWVGQVLDRP